jgi:hypothetical protein
MQEQASPVQLSLKYELVIGPKIAASLDLTVIELGFSKSALGLLADLADGAVTVRSLKDCVAEMRDPAAPLRISPSRD